MSADVHLVDRVKIFLSSFDYLSHGIAVIDEVKLISIENLISHIKKEFVFDIPNTSLYI